MLKTLLLLTVLAGQGQEPPKQAAGPLISKMFARYSSAQTIVGTVKLIQTAAGTTVTVDSVLQIERPSKVYLRQERKSSDPFTFIVSSDGKRFSYNVPEDSRRFAKTINERLVEPVEFNGVVQTVGDMYLAAADSLGDRSAAFDIAFGRREDLRYLTEQWPSLAYRGVAKAGGVDAHLIQGTWRLNAASPTNGTFDLYITDDGELKRYATKVRILTTAGEQIVTSVWDVQLSLTAKPDPNLFKVVL